MKKILTLLLISILILSCSSNDERLPNSNDVVVGSWQLESQIIDGAETLNSCTKQTVFTFEEDLILRQVFYIENNGVCTRGNELISSWFNNGNSRYSINNSAGNSRILTFTFSSSNTEFSTTENSNGSTIYSLFKKIN